MACENSQEVWDRPALFRSVFGLGPCCPQITLLVKRLLLCRNCSCLFLVSTGLLFPSSVHCCVFVACRFSCNSLSCLFALFEGLGTAPFHVHLSFIASRGRHQTVATLLSVLHCTGWSCRNEWIDTPPVVRLVEGGRTFRSLSVTGVSTCHHVAASFGSGQNFVFRSAVPRIGS